MCYRAMRAVFGCSMDLLASVAGTPKAKASPCPYRAPRLGLLFISVLGMFSFFFFSIVMVVACTCRFGLQCSNNKYIRCH
jgi:hypothetical protein